MTLTTSVSNNPTLILTYQSVQISHFVLIHFFFDSPEPDLDYHNCKFHSNIDLKLY